LSNADFSAGVPRTLTAISASSALQPLLEVRPR
jgi:hypothetical protein